MLTVEKYGGSSVATTRQIKDIALHIKKGVLGGNQFVIVASAMGKTTNSLISLAKEVSLSPNVRELDALLAIGEIQTVSLLSMALCSMGVKAVSLTGGQAGITTNGKHGSAFIDSIEIEKVKSYLDKGYVVCIAGFQGLDKSGDFTTLGRGGSDTTAVALASALNCPCDIFTDVDGVHTLDPRIFKNAKRLKQIGYDDMMELAVNGAKVLETRCIELAKKYRVKLYLGRTLEKGRKGTYVMNNYFEKMNITGIAVRREVGIMSIEVKDGMQETLEILSKYLQNLEMFNQLQCGNKRIITFVCDAQQAKSIKKEMKKYQKCAFLDNLSKITLVGNGITTHFSLPQTVCSVLEKEGIEVQNLIQSETSLSLTVRREDFEKAVSKLIVEFEL